MQTEQPQSSNEAAGGASAVERVVRRFRMAHKVFERLDSSFTELDAPAWLTSTNTRPGSTMDNRWFWKDHVLMLQVGEAVETDFRVITRTA